MYQPARVLLAGDNAHIRESLRLQLEAESAVVVVGEAADGHEAGRLAGELQPDVAVLDLSMPGLDGLQAVPLIRQAVPGVKVTILSGFEAESRAEQVAAAGADCYLVNRVGTNLSEAVQGVQRDPSTP